MRVLKNLIKVLLIAVLLSVVYGQITNPPVVLIQPVSADLPNGGTISLTALASGVTDYQWIFNGVPVANLTNYYVLKTNAQPTDAGIYVLRAANRFGYVLSSPATITLTAPPGSATTNSSIPVMVAWDANTESDLAGYKVYYWKDGTTNQVMSVDVGNKTRFILPLTAPASTYRFYATAYNASGLESGPSTLVDDWTPGYKPALVNGVNSTIK
jgi:hypothetical protein